MVMPRLRIWDSPVFVDVREVVEFLGQVFEVSERFLRPHRCFLFRPLSWFALILEGLSSVARSVFFFFIAYRLFDGWVC
jgi:hypothetical protein